MEGITPVEEKELPRSSLSMSNVGILVFQFQLGGVGGGGGGQRVGGGEMTECGTSVKVEKAR